MNQLAIPSPSSALDKAGSFQFNAADYGFLETNDGLANAQALQALSRDVEAAGKASVLFPAGDYEVGHQFENTTAVWLYEDARVTAFAPHEMFNILGADTVLVWGYGCKIKFSDGLKFGSFDPSTGNIYSHANTAFVDNSYIAAQGSMFKFRNCNQVAVMGFELDGNSINTTLGGWWGNVGWQVQSYLVQAKATETVVFQDINAYNCPLDAFNIWDDCTAEGDYSNHHVINCRGTYCGRQGLTITGSMSCIVDRCEFSFIGRAPNTGSEAVDNLYIASGPHSGIDIEAEGGKIIRNVHIKNTKFIGNRGWAVVAASGDSQNITVEDCFVVAPGESWGGAGGSFYLGQPYFKVIRSRIFGGWISFPYTHADSVSGVYHPANPELVDCVIDDDASPWGMAVSTSQYMLNAADGTGKRIKGCSVTLRDSPTTIRRWAIFRDGVFENCDFYTYQESLANRTYLALLDRIRLIDTRFHDKATSPPVDGYYIGSPSAGAGPVADELSEIISANSKLKWFSWSVGGGGHTGKVGDYSTWGWRAAKELFPGRWFWTVNSSGQLRVHNAKPASDADGAAVGAQT